MIDQVSINNNLGETLTVKIMETNPASGLFISGIDGLGTVKSDIRMQKIATQHGSKYNSSRAESRDIVFHFLYSDGYVNDRYISAEEARINTYKFFPLGERITITFYTDYYTSKNERRTLRVSGYVESNDPEIFSEPLAGSAITVSCPSPWFYIPGQTGKMIETFSNLEATFEFPEQSYSGAYDAEENSPEYGFLEFEPLEDDVIAKDDSKPTKGGTKIFTALRVNETHNVYYRGEVETGMLITISGNGFFRFPTIYNIGTGEKMTINTDVIEKMLNPAFDPNASPAIFQVGPGDEIRISTDPQNKYIRYYMDGAEKFNIINAIDLNADWLTLRPGNNQFAYSCTEGNLNIDITMEATIYLQGV